ncbi:MAG: glycosyltransferase family 2 protein [Cytophagales bacterium]|uniref:glycosyltransferase n=1 Tax=Cyclobacterium marinum TaxID=104 RepID=UPI0030DD3BDA|nr:glycosyltransferase family 2 protein [Cytophagales bacterium]
MKVKESDNSGESLIDVSVIIPTYRDWERLNLCLLGLKKQNFPSSKFEIIVVNNDPYDPKPDFVEASGCKIIEEKTPGSYAARNAGMKIANGDIYAFTDSDCIPDPNWIKEGLKEMKNSKVSRVGGKIKLFRPENGSYFAFVYEKYLAFQQERNVKVFKKSVTGNFFAKKHLFEQFGAFDEKLMSGGDFYWNLRLSEFGEKISFAEMAVINHPSRTSLSEIAFKKKRTISGYYRETFIRLKFGKKLLTLLKRLMPPINRINHIEFESTKDYFQVLIIRWYVESVGVMHLIKLQWASIRNKNI